MQKIPFSNNSEPAINDTNLNLMQDYIETAIQGSVGGDTLPVGSIMPFGGGTVPDNYLLCDGQAVSRTEYATLFQTIGTAFGVGDGSTTFNLPDLRGKHPMGYDNTQTEFNALGKTGGEKKHTQTVNEMPSHTHNVVTRNNSATGLYEIKGTNATGDTGSKPTESSGGGQPFNVLDPYQTTNYIIKAFQTAGVVASVVNAHSNSTTNVYSASYVNGLNTYSTTETRIGTWIDGKPLYRKVVSFGTLPNADTKRVAHGISNLDEVISVFGISKRYIPSTQTYSWQSLPLVYQGSSSTFNTSLSISGTNIAIGCDSDRTEFTQTYIFIEYTKTTD